MRTYTIRMSVRIYCIERKLERNKGTPYFGLLQRYMVCLVFYSLLNGHCVLSEHTLEYYLSWSYLPLTIFFFLGAVTLVNTVSSWVDDSSGASVGASFDGGPSNTVSMGASSSEPLTNVDAARLGASSSESSTKVEAARLGAFFFLVLSIHIPSTGFSMSPTMAWATRRVSPKPLPPEIQMPPLLIRAAIEPLRAKNLSWTSRLAKPSASYDSSLSPSFLGR